MAIVAVLGSFLAWPSEAGAHPLTRSSFHYAAVGCEGTTPIGPIRVWVDINTPAGISIQIDDNDEWTWLPVYTSGLYESVGVTIAGSSLDVEVPMQRLVDADAELYEPAGIATLHLDWAPSGAPIEFSEAYRNGNGVQKFVSTQQLLTGAGAVAFEPIGSVGFDCGGEVYDQTVTSNNPDTTFGLNLRDDMRVECQIVDPDGSVLLLLIDPFFPRFIYTTAGGNSYYASGLGGDEGSFPALTPAGMAGDFSWLNAFGGDVMDVGRIDLQLAASGIKNTYRSHGMTSTGTVIERPYTVVSGVVTAFSDTFDLSSCDFVNADVRVLLHDPVGRGPGGPPPANDLLEGATSLPVGTSSTSTRGAATGAEASCADALGEEVVPFGRTIWYSVDGAGGLVTVDTAGSDFDTAIAVYVGSTDHPLACIDDVQLGLHHNAKTQQASITFLAEAGHRYLLQVGGWVAHPIRRILSRAANTGS